MLTGMLAMALYNVLSRPLMSRSSALGYAAAGMGFGSGFNALAAWHGGGFERVPSFGAAEWLAALYLGALGGALAFYLWVYALQRTTPTRVANTITVSPIAAALLAAVLLGESIGASLVIGVAAVAAGIWIASTEAAGKIGPPPLPHQALGSLINCLLSRCVLLNVALLCWLHFYCTFLGR